MSASHRLVKWLVHFRDRTPAVQGSMGLLRMCTERMAEVKRPFSASCTDLYSGCTKMPYARQCSTWVGEVACAFSGMYTYYIQGTTGLSRMCSETMAEARRLPLWSCTDPYSGVQKCRLRVSAPHGLVKWLVHFQECTLTIQGATGLPRMCSETMADVKRPPSGSCTDPYSRCTKMPFARAYSAWVFQAACAFSASYTYCTRCYRTAQDVYRAYGTGCVQSLWLS